MITCFSFPVGSMHGMTLYLFGFDLAVAETKKIMSY